MPWRQKERSLVKIFIKTLNYLAGIYIHIPFCKQACHYCNFHFSTSLRYKNELIPALLKEMELQRDYFVNETVETIYIGGGTPSLCSANEINRILAKAFSNYHVNTGAEITLEANPDDITKEKLAEWKNAGINRLSMGVQSFYDDELLWMNRAHTAKMAMDSLVLATRDFNNISLDLIYGLPVSNNDKWKQNVDKVIALGIPHLSCYALTVEPKTPLQKLIHLKKAEDVNPDQQSEQFMLLMQWMAVAGYEHYEISNFARTGFRSRHNSSYWQQKKYLGFGPSAHSFDGHARWWNVSNNNIYIQSINNGKTAFEKEVLTPVQKLNEYIMTSLRTIEGLDLSGIDETRSHELRVASKKYIENGQVRMEGSFLKLTKEGKLLADGIAADLFFTK